MAFDRQSIERRDFPITRRGYDPESVDRHLAALADEYEEMRTRAAAGGLDASTRRVGAQLDGAQREIDILLAALRGGVARVAERLMSVESEIPNVVPRPGAPAPVAAAPAPVAAAPAPAPAPAPAAPAPTPATPEPVERAPTSALRSDERPVGAIRRRRASRPSVSQPSEPPPVPAASVPQKVPVDIAGARLVALDMALAGNPREDVSRYLREQFPGVDDVAVLDAVYASI